MSYQGQKLEIRISKSETNPKFQTAILKRRGACFERALPFCSFFHHVKKSKKAEPARLPSRCALLLCILNLPFWPLPFVSDFELGISDFLTAEISILINWTLHQRWCGQASSHGLALRNRKRLSLVRANGGLWQCPNPSCSITSASSVTSALINASGCS